MLIGAGIPIRGCLLHMSTAYLLLVLKYLPTYGGSYMGPTIHVRQIAILPLGTSGIDH